MTSPRRIVLVLVALAGLFSAASCFGTRKVRDVLRGSAGVDPTADLPTREQLLALRVPPPADAPPELALHVPRDALDALRLASARGALDDVLAPAASEVSSDVELGARRCLVAHALGEPAATVERCTAFVDAAPADPRAVAAVGLIKHAASEVQDADRRLASAARGWLDACAASSASCFDLTAALSDAVVDEARAHPDRNALRASAARIGRLLDAEVAGPFRGDDVLSFADPALPVPLIEHAPYTTEGRMAFDDGELVPAVRGRSGLYRLRFHGSGGGPAVVLASSARPLRVLVDGVVVLERRRDREEPLVSRAAIELAAGAHLVEVLVISLGGGDATTVALVDDQGHPVLSPLGAAPERTAGARRRTLSGAAEQLAAPTTTSALDLAALDRLLWRHALASARVGLNAHDERAVADLLVARYGFSGEALIAAATTVAADPELPRRQAWSFAEPLWRRAQEVWPTAVRPRFALDQALRAQQPERGLPLMARLVDAHPTHAPALRALIADALEAGLVDEGRQAAEALLKVARTARNVDSAVPAFEAVGDLAGAARLQAERDTLVRSLASDALARAALRRGDTEAALALFKRAAEADPYGSALASWIDLVAGSDAARALELVDEALKRAPQADDLLRRRAALTLHVQGPDAARAFVLRALRASPANNALLRLAEALGVQQRWQERLGLGDAVLAQRRAMAEPFRGYAAVYLLDDLERSVALDGSSTAVRHTLVELRTKEAIDRFGEISLSDERVVVLRVVKPDGRVVEPDINAGVSDASLPGLAPGDVVELLSVSRASASPYPQSAYETRSLDLMSLPALSRSYSVDAPVAFIEATGLRAVVENGAPDPVREQFTDPLGVERVRYTSRLTDVPAARPEPFEPAREETSRTVGFAFGVDAALWARARGRGLRLDAQPSPWLTASAERIAGSGSAEEKLARVVAFVARRIEPGDASDAAEVLATGQGRRTALLLALLRAAGLRAEPVALHFPSQPPLHVIDPSAWSTVAVQIPLPGHTAFAVVDGVVVLDALPPAARGASVLDLSFAAIARNQARITVLPDSAIDDEGTSIRVDLRRAPPADGAALVGDVVLDVPAALADGLRRDLKKAPPDVTRSWVEQALQPSFPGLSALDVRVPDVEQAGTRLRIEADVRVPLTPLADGTVRFEHLFAPGAAATFGLAAPVPAALGVVNRTRPLLISADHEVLEVRVALGDDASAFFEMPGNLEREAGPFALSQTAEVTDGTLLWRRSLRLTTTRVAPATWTTLRPALAELVSHLDARAAFVIEARAASGPL